MPSASRDQVATDWASRGFGCDLWTDPPGQQWEDFRHATDELVTVLEGEMEFDVAGHVHRPQSWRGAADSCGNDSFGAKHR